MRLLLSCLITSSLLRSLPPEAVQLSLVTRVLEFRFNEAETIMTRRFTKRICIPEDQH